jgi:hypothetical protein
MASREAVRNDITLASSRTGALAGPLELRQRLSAWVASAFEVDNPRAATAWKKHCEALVAAGALNLRSTGLARG